MAKSASLTEQLKSRLRTTRQRAIALVGTVIAAAFIVTLPPAPAQYSLTLSVTDPNTGVYTNASDCAPRPDYTWLDTPLTVVPTATEVSPAPVINVVSVGVSRSGGDTCAYEYKITVSSPPADPISQIFGANKVPNELGSYDAYLGSEQVGAIRLNRSTGSSLEINKTIVVASNMLGVYEIGFKADKCTGEGAGLNPAKWKCTWSYLGSNPKNFSTNETKGTCAGLRSYTDLKAGAIVTVEGDHGTVRGKLVAPITIGLELQGKGVETAKLGYYLLSKSSKIMYCPLAWEIQNVPYSPSGYTITVGKRSPYFISASEMETAGYFSSKQVGDRP